MGKEAIRKIPLFFVTVVVQVVKYTFVFFAGLSVSVTTNPLSALAQHTTGGMYHLTGMIVFQFCVSVKPFKDWTHNEKQLKVYQGRC